jgi:hypothetical protein
MTKNWTKITAESFIFIFLIKNCNLPSLGLHKVCPSYRRSLQFSKKAIQHFKTWTFTNYCLLLWVIFALLDPDPDSEYGSGSGSTDPIEYGSNPDSDPDPQPCFYVNLNHIKMKVWTGSASKWKAVSGSASARCGSVTLILYRTYLWQKCCQVGVHLQQHRS